MTPEKCSKTYCTLPSPHKRKNFSPRKNNKVTNTTPYDIHLSEKILPSHMHTKLPQLRANKSPLLQAYLHTANSETYMSHCLTHTHMTLTLL